MWRGGLWERFTEERFSEVQAKRGRACGKARREAGAQRDTNIRELIDAGYSQTLVANVVGVSRRTVYSALHAESGNEPYQDNNSCGCFRVPAEAAPARSNSSPQVPGSPQRSDSDSSVIRPLRTDTARKSNRSCSCSTASAWSSIAPA